MRHLPLLLFCILVFGCSQAENSNLQVNVLNTNAANLNTSNQPETAQTSPTKQEAISSDGKLFESLTADSNYFDVVKLLGTPDAETDLPQLKSPFPMVLACYKQNACILLLNEDNLHEKSIKSNLKYVGALRLQPPEILHSSKPKYLDLLEAVRTIVLKKMVEQVKKEVKRQKGK